MSQELDFCLITSSKYNWSEIHISRPTHLDSYFVPLFSLNVTNLSFYFGRTRSDFISLSHFRLLAMTDARSCLERPVSLSSWSINIVAGRSLERLPRFGSQRSSWETVSFLFLQQWAINLSRRIWRLVEIGARSPLSALLDIWSLKLMFRSARSSLVKQPSSCFSSANKGMQNKVTCATVSFLWKCAVGVKRGTKNDTT